MTLKSELILCQVSDVPKKGHKLEICKDFKLLATRKYTTLLKLDIGHKWTFFK